MNNDGSVLDTVIYAPSYSYPMGAGVSLTLGSESASDNDTGGYWCEGLSTYGDGDLGTPGASNDVCDLPLLNAIAVSDLNAGDLVISEIMHDPDAVSDYRGEWFEVYNATTTLTSTSIVSISEKVYRLHTILTSGDYLPRREALRSQMVICPLIMPTTGMPLNCIWAI